jgi:hypothetical protein
MLFRKLNPEGMFSFCDKDGIISDSNPCTCINFAYNDIALPWYEEIPEEGVICFVWDDIRNKTMAKIIGYDGSDCPFQSINDCWYISAVPLTSEQLSLYDQLMAQANAL